MQNWGFDDDGEDGDNDVDSVVILADHLKFISFTVANAVPVIGFNVDSKMSMHNKRDL